MKIQKIKLYKQSLVEMEDDFKLEITDIETVPCVITNRALQLCNQLGVNDSSLVQDLLIMTQNAQVTENGDIVITKIVEDEKILKAIYTGYVGGQLLLGNIEPKYNYDEFIERYHDSSSEKYTIYQSIAMASQNDFVKEIEKSTNKATGKDVKK